jgi:steroid 5-alpha reductase family enzyme
MRKNGALLVCLGVYLLALLAAVLSGRFLRGGHPLFVVFIADLVATVVVFAFSMIFDNSSIYDPYWSVTPPLIALYWLTAGGLPDRLPARSLLALALIVLWSVRLTFNWVRRWKGIRDEDWRYRELRERYRSLYWPVSFFGIHLFPTLIVFLGCLSLYPVMSVGSGSPRSFGLLDILAAAVTLAAIAVETTADRQLHAYKQRAPKSGQIFSQGLWSRCRHPNYLGEVLFWWGLYLFCLAASPSHWWFIIGPAAMTALFFRISVPMMDRHLLARKSGYAEHIQRVPGLLPRPFCRKNDVVHQKN